MAYIIARIRRPNLKLLIRSFATREKILSTAPPHYNTTEIKTNIILSLVHYYSIINYIIARLIPVEKVLGVSMIIRLIYAYLLAKLPWARLKPIRLS
jgi:hypothetical protein